MNKFEIVIEPQDEELCGNCAYVGHRWAMSYGNFSVKKWCCELFQVDLNYQIKDLPAGNYYLWASGETTMNGRGTKWFIAKFYPDIIDPAQAQVLNVTQNLSNLNFTLAV